MTGPSRSEGLARPAKSRHRGEQGGDRSCGAVLEHQAAAGQQESADPGSDCAAGEQGRGEGGHDQASRLGTDLGRPGLERCVHLGPRAAQTGRAHQYTDGAARDGEQPEGSEREESARR